jgi:hypothetical protein
MKRVKDREAKIFNSDGTVQEAELKIVNLRPIGNNKLSSTGDSGSNNNNKWEEVKDSSCQILLLMSCSSALPSARQKSVFPHPKPRATVLVGSVLK